MGKTSPPGLGSQLTGVAAQFMDAGEISVFGRESTTRLPFPDDFISLDRIVTMLWLQ
jgi:hypothetical protein